MNFYLVGAICFMIGALAFIFSIFCVKKESQGLDNKSMLDLSRVMIEMLTERCEWEHIPGTNNYKRECGGMSTIIDTKSENSARGFNFCFSCGKRIRFKEGR